MEMQIEFIKRRRPGASLAIFFAFALSTATMQASAQAVKPPPLPPGSSMVKIKGGMDDNEVKRHERAHRHKGHKHKDINHDDSEPAGKKKGSNNGNQNNPGRK